MTRTPAVMCLQPARRPPISLDGSSVFSKEVFAIPPHYYDSVESVLIPHGLIVDRVVRLAQDIREDYGDSTPHLLCILKVRGRFYRCCDEAIVPSTLAMRR